MSRRRWGDPLARDPKRRQARVNDLIRRNLSLILEREYRDQLAAMATVTEVRITGDLRHARVFVAVTAEPERQEQTIRRLKELSPELRSLLGREIILKHVPSLEFILDLSAERARRIEELLQGYDSEAEHDDHND
ncbi:MAG: 30S ribosome-binding factor RbfA [Candidatus Zixiibacteriota bacterium]|nr:MAG: 30S ribosome-binding factor RbfA [candidate division Zixibacteria bacterium]